MEDQVKLVVICGSNGYFLEENSSRSLCLLSSPVLGNNNFMDVALELLNKELGATGDVKGIVKILREYEETSSGSPISRLTVIYLVELDTAHQSLASSGCKKWITDEEVAQLSKLSVEPLTWDILNAVAEKRKRNESVYPSEVLECVKACTGVDRRRVSENSRPQILRVESLVDQLLSASEYGCDELKQIEDMFVCHCGSASSLMNLDQFTSLLTHLGFLPALCRQCFNALKVDPGAEGLTLSDIQVGLCCLDPFTIHGGLSAQFRCQFIFYFYSYGREQLYFSEFSRLVRDVYSFKKIVMEESELEKAIMDNWRIFSADVAKGISLDMFLIVVGQLKFRGTSVLFRLPHPPVKHRNGASADNAKKSITDQQVSDMQQTDGKMDTTSEISLVVPPSDDRQVNGSHSLSLGKGDGDLSRDDLSLFSEEAYTIATHFVKVKRSGMLTDVSTLWDLVGTEAMSGSLDYLLDVRPGFERLPSINAFDKQSKSNEMLSGLRYFEHALKDNGRGNPKMEFSWGAVDMVSVAKCFMHICAKAVDTFSSETRVLEITSPCYVLGDLHGNFHDLVCFEKVLWRMGAVLTPANFLFLGDYVDRGPHGFEVVAYLFAQKLLTPSKFQLIRGNHEIRAVQESFTFKKECVNKFGEELGLELWESANAAFDAMPVAAIIDQKVFCVHGGIPLPCLEGKGLISAINDIPPHLSNPFEESLLAWDMLWNDPIRQDEIDDTIEVQLLQQNGFIDNFARGTAHMFSAAALQEFLIRNGLSHVIRAHECKAAGFQIQLCGKLLTVFSSSHYCGSTNEAACILVDSKKIRTIRLDTT